MHRNPFETVPADINTVIGTVGREAREECTEYACAIFPILDECVSRAVSSRWESRIKTYVPLLALRDVRECIRAGHCGDIA